MKNQSNKGMVEIPAVTLSALKGLLFNDNGNIDLTPLVNDLSIGLDEGRKDLMAINVALTFKGLKPEIDVPEISYKGDWRTVRVYIYQGFSLIEGVAAFKVHTLRWNENIWTLDTKVNNEVLGLGQVDEYLTSNLADIKMQGIKEDECPIISDIVPFVEEIQRSDCGLE